MKNSIKKILAATLAAAMVLTVAPATAFAAGSKSNATEPTAQTDEDASVKKNGVSSVTVNTNASGKATIYSVETTSTKAVTVPTSVKVNGISYSVTKVGKDAFAGVKVAKVTLPAKITKIGKAFNGISGLKNLVIKGSSVKIAKNAFKGAKVSGKLTVTVPKNFKNLKALKAALKNAGIKYTIKRA